MMGRELPVLMKPRLVMLTLVGTKTETRRVVLPQPAQNQIPGEVTGLGSWREHPIDSGRFRWHYQGHTRGNLLFNCTTLHGKVKPRYKVGDVLYTRETIWQLRHFAFYDAAGKEVEDPADSVGKAKTIWDGQVKYLNHEWRPGYQWEEKRTKRLAGEFGYGLRPSIYCPKWASRTRIRVTAVNIERLQKITPQACKGEGAIPVIGGEWEGYVQGFVKLWNDINGKRDRKVGPGSWPAEFGPYCWQANPWVIVYKYELVEKPLGDMPTEASERGNTECDGEEAKDKRSKAKKRSRARSAR